MLLGLNSSATPDMDCSLCRGLSIHRAIAGNVQLDTAADCNLNLRLWDLTLPSRAVSVVRRSRAGVHFHGNASVVGTLSTRVRVSWGRQSSLAGADHHCGATPACLAAGILETGGRGEAGPGRILSADCLGGRRHRGRAMRCGIAGGRRIVGSGAPNMTLPEGQLGLLLLAGGGNWKQADIRMELWKILD